MKPNSELTDPGVTNALHEPVGPIESNDLPGRDGLAELRNLLLAPEQTRLFELQQRLDNPKLRAQDLAQVLPEAVRLGAAQSQELSSALTPIVEEAIQASVKRDPKIIVDAIFPAIGPAIRKAISAALSGMIQSLNEALEHSLSLQGLKWRLEALRTGKPFAEVVLLHSLVYRVEQVMLIHRQTGLLLHSVVAPSVTVRDADMVSGMLTAIQDFAHDSFRLQKEEALETMRVGELTVWIEPGPAAFLVGVIRGNAPHELMSAFQDAIKEIHREDRHLLESFEGDTAPFESCRPYLESCLEVRYASKGQKQISAPLLVAAGLILAVLGVWGFFMIRNQQRWSGYVERLQTEPGLLVVATERREGKYFVSGLRDPLAADPGLMLREAKLSPDQVISQWQPYQSVAPQFVLARATALLDPPATVNLGFENGVLSANGVAPLNWITETRRLARFIPGVERFRDDQLLAENSARVESLKAQIEKHVLFFEGKGSQFVSSSEQTLRTLAAEIQQLTAAAQIASQAVHIEIAGHTDSSGSVNTNLQVGQRRADRVLQALVARGVKAAQLSAGSLGAKEPLTSEAAERDRALNRRVTLRVRVTPADRSKRVQP